MAASSATAVQVDVGDTFGPVLIGVIISSCLYGVTCLQSWHYFRNYNDRFLLRVISARNDSCDSIYSHRVPLPDPEFWQSRPFGDRIWLTAINTIVHLFYAARIYQLSNKRDWWTPGIVCLLKVAHILRLVETLTENGRIIILVTIASFACLVTLDVICAVALSTNTLINKLIVHTINNGALTSVASASIIIFLVPVPKNLIFFAIYVVEAKLNSRRSHVNALPVAVEPSNLSFATSGLSSGVSSAPVADAPSHTVDFPEPHVEVLIKMKPDVHYAQQDVELSEGNANPGRD
ncbi:hypothetical protein WG66_006602 [Moniliophthora roreri]|nr:hypothetical protein WG66_006602 [Moniliophthora roreri]